MRTIPEFPGAPAGVGTDAALARMYRVHVVTPIFGGGTTPGINDPLIIRGSSIRGQLRFWWRATRGSRFAEVASLRREEERIWGSTTVPSRVSIWVRNVIPDSQGQWAYYELVRKSGMYRKTPRPARAFLSGYVLFPFNGEAQGDTILREPASVTWAASFHLRIRFPCEMDVAKDIDAAVWAWVNFGGLGSRTRRGCGALCCQGVSPSDVRGLHGWYRAKLRELDIDPREGARPWPTVPADILAKDDHVMPPAEAWFHAVKVLEVFRQGTGVAREPSAGSESSNRTSPGRSLWPEADSIRWCDDPLSFEARGAEKPLIAFPRAELGLPIGFQFKGPGEPGKYRLVPGRGERMASPLILKPLATEENKAVPMLMRLRTEPLEAVALIPEDRGGDAARREFTVDAIRGRNIADSVNGPLVSHESGSALDAFMEFAGKRGFR